MFITDVLTLVIIVVPAMYWYGNNKVTIVNSCVMYSFEFLVNI